MNQMGRDPAPRSRPPESEDEIGFLSKSFNAMSARIANLMRETESAHQREKEHEIRALQAQIDPHFLSNTLDTINWIARERNEQKISRMLTALSQNPPVFDHDGRHGDLAGRDPVAHELRVPSADPLREQARGPL